MRGEKQVHVIHMYRDTYKYYNPRTDRDNDLLNNIQGSKYDVAKNWGGNWRMPSKAEFEELLSKCSWKWITIAGTNGYKITSSNGMSIFLPANGSFFLLQNKELRLVFGGNIGQEHLRTQQISIVVLMHYNLPNQRKILKDATGM